MDEIYVNPNNDYLSYLEHHGISGQKWGVRNAGWYPIEAFRKASDKVGTKVHEFKQKRAAEKRRKQRAANLQKAREARAKKQQEEKEFAEEKKRILTSGTPGEVVKIAPRLTNQELQDATLRNSNLSRLRELEKMRLKDIEDAEYAKKYAKFDKIAKAVNKVSGYAKTATDAYSNISKVFKILDKATSDSANSKETGKKDQDDKKSNKQKQTVENISNDKDQRGEFKSKVVDADWTEVVNSDNVSTALTVLNKAIESFEDKDRK